VVQGKRDWCQVRLSPVFLHGALHSGKSDDQVQFYAFDMLAGDSDYIRALPLTMRKANLARLLARRSDGIFIAPFEQGEIGPDLFQAACNMGLEGLVSKRRDRPYRAGRSRHWLKVKNPKSAAMVRAKEVDWSRQSRHLDARR
jgi:bifunctional non-homologous end joining protein LigD